MYLQILHFLVTLYVDSFNNYYVVLYQAAQSNLAEYPNITLTTDALFEKIIDTTMIQAICPLFNESPSNNSQYHPPFNIHWDPIQSPILNNPNHSPCCIDQCMSQYNNYRYWRNSTLQIIQG